MPVCATNYVCTPVWYTSADLDVIALAAGPHAVDLNVTCFVGTGDVQFQVRNPTGGWFTPSESAYTVVDSNLVRLPRANMPDVRVLASGNAQFSIEGSLSF